jgi:hypothetical protein
MYNCQSTALYNPHYFGESCHLCPPPTGAISTMLRHRKSPRKIGSVRLALGYILAFGSASSRLPNLAVQREPKQAAHLGFFLQEVQKSRARQTSATKPANMSTQGGMCRSRPQNISSHKAMAAGIEESLIQSGASLESSGS